MTDKRESQRIQDEIRQVLLKNWDPIDIKDEPLAQGEYDMYIPGVFTLLTENSSDEEISAYLWKIIEERIHRHPPRGATEETVRALRKIRLA
ncbi:MAG: hypothetical protein WCE53_01120 [Candidatus Acidiferrum sp.]